MTLTRESEALLDRISSLNGRSFPLATRDDFAAIEAAVRAEQAAELAGAEFATKVASESADHWRRAVQDMSAEVERLRALAPSWVAFAHGYAHQPDWHSESDWRDCESYPCNEARAALAAAPVAPAPAEPRP